MAKKDKKAKKDTNDGAQEAVDAVRGAVERALASAGGAAGARERTSQIIDEFATFAGRFRKSLDDLNVLEEVRGLRKEVETLAGRIAALEVTAKPAASTSRSTTTRRATTAKKPASRASSGSSSTRKPAASRSRSGSSSTTRRSTSTRSSGSGSGSSGGGSSRSSGGSSRSGGTSGSGSAS
jgi:hypothetical protein